MTEDTDNLNPHIEMTAEIVAAYVSRNSVPAGELPNLIRSIHQTVSTLGAPPVAEVALEPLKPAVPVKRSITDEYIISLEDGRKLKSMKRYLAGLGMTPAQYREKWGLPHDYPMVAPSYAAHRSALAKTLGLGRRASQEAAEAAPEAEPEVDEAPAAEAEGSKKPRRRGAKAA
ncbi:MucR family transcriptional regulator [Lichenibacterium ramalinae]|uniref:MucR family transcriptional regulator n=1 Tax=Lichenibacterium ramalinae TaxID=2316527 RepID=A0A4Q2RAC3_9HYPH|nr:MucR family transcriptional regulator [Lichenibacterium ramalinae]RYB03983.1 MucR family transcriptional regulator [Lichenibacterium ramalinae]